MKGKFIVITAVLTAAILFSLSACGYSAVLTANWGFSLPNEAGFTEIYSADTGSSPHGDGKRYHIFSYESEEPVEKMLDWSSAESEMAYDASYSEAVGEWLGRIAVPGEYWPDIAECVYYYERKDGNDEIIIFWNSGENRLYILESFL